MSRKRLMQEMDAKEVFNWMAFEMSIEPEMYKKLKAEISKENSKKMTDEQRAQAIKNMFNSISKVK